MESIVIVGAGGLARETAFVIEEINRDVPTWDILGFVERSSEAVGRQLGKFSVVANDEYLLSSTISVAFGIGDPAVLLKLRARFGELSNLRFPNLIHPSVIGDRDRISFGRGNVVCAGTIMTTDISIGSFNYLNLGCTYGHDVEIGDCCVINPGANISGGVSIGDGCLVGTGAKILQNVSIGPGATIGAGAVVTRDVAASDVVVGMPAKSMRK